MEKEAEALALEQVAAMLQRPDQLEKLPELRKKADRKKAAVEAMLRTGVQSQLEGIRTAIAHLQTAAEDIAAVDTGITSIGQRLKPFPELKERMRELRDANARHGQYAAAMENLKHIFNINQTIEDIRVSIDQGKLLLAHKHIMDLELARDELLFEVHKFPTSPADKEKEKKLLVRFFLNVDEMVSSLASNIWFIVARALEMSNEKDGQGAEQLVTCLRIIEREERIDKYYVDRKRKEDDFMPPGRPREWRKKTFEVLEKKVWNRVSASQLEDRTTRPRGWLARYLEICRSVLVGDLQMARNAVPCFPPEYQIYDRFVHMYHSCICQRLRDLVSEKLEKDELVQLMSWVQIYPSEEALGHRRLQINVPALLQDMPLLMPQSLNSLCDLYVEMTVKDLKAWLEKTLSTEKDEWYKNMKPDEDNFGFFYTSLPNILFGMLRDIVAMAKQISIEIIPKCINIVIIEFIEFAGKYKDAFCAYKNKYFEDRSRLREFTSTMIAISNNCNICIESTEKQLQQIRLSMEEESGGNATRRRVTRHEIIDNIETLKAKWNASSDAAISYLHEEVYADIAPHVGELFSRKWLGGSVAMETVCMTIGDYHTDHRHLRSTSRAILLMRLQFSVLSEYLRAVDSRRLSFAALEERQKGGSRMKSDVTRLDQVFEELTEDPEVADQFSLLTPVLSCAAEVISLSDKSLLSLEATSFSRKFPNIPVDLLASLLASREDVGRTESKTMAEEALSAVKLHPKDPLMADLFTMVGQSDSSLVSMQWLPRTDMSHMFTSFMKRDQN